MSALKKLEWASALDLPPTWKLPFANFGLNRAFQGGLTSGMIHCFTGPTGSGKSTQADKAIAYAQSIGKVCAYVDAEKTFSEEMAVNCGVDVSKLRYLREGSNRAENVANIVCTELADHKIDLVVIDSLSMINLESFYTDPTANPMGINARTAGFLLSKIIDVLHRDQQVILIAHVSNQKMGQHFVLTAKAGNAMQHTVSNMVMFKLRQGKDNIREDGYQKVAWQIQKAKQSILATSGEYYFKGQISDFDQIDEIVIAAKELDILTGTTWLNYGDQKFHGKTKLVEQLRWDLDLRDSLIRDIAEWDSKYAQARIVDGLDEEEAI